MLDSSVDVPKPLIKDLLTQNSRAALLELTDTDSSSQWSELKKQVFLLDSKIIKLFAPYEDKELTNEDITRLKEELVAWKEQDPTLEKDWQLIGLGSYISSVCYANEESFENVGILFGEAWNDIPSEIQERALIQGIKISVLRQEMDDYEWLKEHFNPADKLIQEGVAKAYADCAEQGWFEPANKLKRQFSRTVTFPPVDKTVWKNGLVGQLRYGGASADMAELAHFCDMSQSEIIQELNNRITSMQSDWPIDTYISIFKLDIESQQNLYNNPTLRDIKEQFEALPSFKQLSFPIRLRFLVMEQDSPGRGISLLKSSDYLVSAIEENKEMASALLAGLLRADDIDRENIAAIYDIYKASIGKHNKLNRNLLNQKLLAYKSNSAIVESMRKYDIDVEQWLNYSEIRTFQLQQEERNVGVLVTTPIERIVRSIEKLQTTYKHLLGPFQEKFTQTTIVQEDKARLEEQLQEINVQLETSQNDERKTKGLIIAKGNLIGKLASIKQISAWQKIFGDLASIQAPLVDVQSLLQNSRNADQTPSGNEKVLNFLQKKIPTIQSRIKAYQSQVKAICISTLGEDVADSIFSEIEAQTNEDVDHLDFDFNSINEIVSKPKAKKSPYVGKTMIVKVWDRNPNVDLFLGNFTNCCVRIDSGIHEGEVPIADYLTDVGIQVIEVIDEEKGIPVVAAWCFPGVDDKGTIKFLIDNIEADTGYSAPFREQITAELKAFIHDYSLKCRIERVYQGPYNNDLVVADFDTTTNKIGGYNKEHGYYLESEQEENEE